MARESLIALGTCIGKFTHSSKFILTIGALDVLAQHAKFKVRSAAGQCVAQCAPGCDTFQSSNRRGDALWINF